MIKTLVLCPLKVELKYIAQNLGASPINILGATGYQTPKFVLAEGGHGKVQFAIKAQQLIHHFPDLDMLVCAGAAGSLDPLAQLCDVVVGTQTIEHDYKEGFENAKKPSVAGSPELLAKAQSLTFPDFKIHFGKIASGDEDVMSEVRAEEIKRVTEGAIAVAWEGIGGAKVSQHNGLSFLEIRAITDNARHDAGESFKLNIKRSMESLSKVLSRIFV